MMYASNIADSKLDRFNSPFFKLTSINIGKYFLNLLDRHFNRDNRKN